MKYRKLGNTDISVSEVGFGGWGIGGPTPGQSSYGPTDDKASLKALQAALDDGINFFDTAPAYGKSEGLVGQAFSGCRDKVVISTKIGCAEYYVPLDFSPAAVRASVEKSLGLLKTDYIDLIQFHNPDPTQENLDETFQTLDELKVEGKIRAVGISLRNIADAAVVFERFDVAAIMYNLNLMDLRALKEGLLDDAVKQGVGFIARTPLCFGYLTRKIDETTTFDEVDHRTRWSANQVHRWVEGSRLFADSIAAETGQTPAQVALRFCLSFNAVTSVIPGILNEGEAHENSAASDLGPLTKEQLEKVNEVYEGLDFMINKVKRPIAMQGVSV